MEHAEHFNLEIHIFKDSCEKPARKMHYPGTIFVSGFLAIFGQIKSIQIAILVRPVVGTGGVFFNSKKNRPNKAFVASMP